jgi:hypothetical protein
VRWLSVRNDSSRECITKGSSTTEAEKRTGLGLEELSAVGQDGR